MRILLCLFGFLLPWVLRRPYLNSVFGYRIAKGARIGFSVVIPKCLEMLEGARIGHLSVIKGLDVVVMGTHAYLGNLNWVSGFPGGDSVHFSHNRDRRPSLFIGEHAAITNRHLIDCTDRVEIGRFATFAGFRSQVLTHSIDLEMSRQSCKPVFIGAYCFVGTGSIILGGARLPDYSVLGAGSLLSASQQESYALYGGIPAKKIQSLPETLGYFLRQRGFVD